jgi:LuxR family maltose regulon positive regulatory protein
VRDLLVELLRHPSPMLHLALLSRRDPPLPVAFLRARGVLSEVNLGQLRFTPAETTAFLEQVLRVSIDEETAAFLDVKLEGWVTGLRLTALSLRQKEDAERILEGLKEGTHYTTDYLIQDVLSSVPLAMARQLMATSILDRLCAPLCDVLYLSSKEQKDSEDLLSGAAFVDWLKETQMFVIPLDEQNHWFRYHHLFQELLKRQLEQNAGPQEIAALYSLASEWFESHGLITESIKNAMAAGDVVRAAGIIERHRNDEFTADRWHVVGRWLAMLPADIRSERPNLLLAEAWIANLQHQLERVPPLLDQAESLLRSQTAEPTVSAEISFFWGYFSYFEGQAERSLQYLEDSVSRLAGTKSPFLAESELMLGLARCMIGQKDLAIQDLEARIGEVDSSENYLLSRLIASLAFIHPLLGDLQLARAEAPHLQRVSSKYNLSLAEAWSYYFLALIHLHSGEFEAASLHFTQVVEQRYRLEPRAAVDALAGLALTQHLMRRGDEAAESCRQLQEFAQELNERNYLSVAHACQARLSLLRGDLNAAVEWGRLIDNTPEVAELFLWLEAPSITQARVLIAAGSEHSLLSATKLLQSIRDLCEACRFTCQIIEVAVLQSLALERQGHTEEALEALKEAITLAEPGGWIRPFVEAGPPMADLLKRLYSQNVAVDYIERLLKAFSADESKARADALEDESPTSDRAVSESPSLPISSPPRHPTHQPLVEPLTNRELEILQLLSQRWQNKEIAEKLFISPNTVKSHLNNINQKLQVRNRRQAVEKARDLGIL